MVLHVCSNIEPAEISDSEVPISHPVLVSLIQQLSVDLEINTDLKVIKPLTHSSFFQFLLNSHNLPPPACVD